MSDQDVNDQGMTPERVEEIIAQADAKLRKIPRGVRRKVHKMAQRHLGGALLEAFPGAVVLPPTPPQRWMRFKDGAFTGFVK